MSKKVFIRYSHGDLDEVKRLAWDLRMSGVDTWIDYDDLLSGENWKKVIARTIRSCGAFLVCVSAKMLRPGSVNAEIQEALDFARSLAHGQIFIVLVLLDDLSRSRIPWDLGAYHFERLHRTGPRREAEIRRLVISLGFPPPPGFGRRAETDYRELCARYFSHVYWWLFGRAIEPNNNAPETAAEGFGDALVEHYMVPTSARSFLVCAPTDRAYPVMRRLQDLLYPNPQTVRDNAVPIIAGLEDARDLRSMFLGLVTPTDLLSKWKHWYVRRDSVAPHVWFEDPRVAFVGSNVRGAYETMSTILTGIPIVEQPTVFWRAFWHIREPARTGPSALLVRAATELTGSRGRRVQSSPPMQRTSTAEV